MGRSALGSAYESNQYHSILAPGKSYLWGQLAEHLDPMKHEVRALALDLQRPVQRPVLSHW